MPRKRKAEQQPIGVGLTAKQMKRKKPINADMLRDIDPLTENQQKLFESYSEGKNIIVKFYFNIYVFELVRQSLNEKTLLSNSISAASQALASTV